MPDDASAATKVLVIQDMVFNRHAPCTLLFHLAIVLGGAALASRTWAQLVEDGQTNVLDGVTNVFASNLIVGSNAPFTALFLKNGAVLSATGVTIGQSDQSFSNLVIVTDAGSILTNSSATYVGDYGSFNSLLISNGARANLGVCRVGQQTNLVGNCLVVAGAGSLLRCRTGLEVGFRGSSNKVVIDDGAIMSNSVGQIAESVYVGRYGSFNQLLVTNGSVVRSYGAGLLGYYASSRSNAVVLTGMGTRWTNLSDMTVGRSGSMNRLEIRDGASVRGGYDEPVFGDGVSELVIGYFSNSTGNALLIDGVNSQLGGFTKLIVGMQGSSNSLTISGGGFVTVSGSSSVGSQGGPSNSVMVTGTGSALVSASNLTNMAGTFTVNSGGLVRNENGIIISSQMIVSDAGSVWSNSLSVSVYGARRSELVITNGGAVVCRNGYVGDHWGTSPSFGRSNGIVTVVGEGSKWQVSETLWVGYGGDNSVLQILEGGFVVASNAYISFATNSFRNRVVISGGSLVVSNAAGNGLYSVSRGTNQLDGGLVFVDDLRVLVGGAFEFNGGTLSTRSSRFTNGVPFVVGNGILPASFQLRGGTNRFTNGLTINPFANLSGTGAIIGHATNSGVLRPGSPVGALRFNGNLTLLPDGGVEFDIGGVAATNEHDVIEVAGAIELAGNLQVSLVGGFYPAPGQSFSLISFSSATGAFAGITSGTRLNTADNLGSFLVTISGTNVVLSDYQSPDTDGDGQSDYAEFMAATDRVDSASVLAITSISRNPAGHVVVRFPFVEGKDYRVLFSDGIPDLGWNTITNPTLSTPEPGFYEWIDDGSSTGGLNLTTRSYRIGLE